MVIGENFDIIAHSVECASLLRFVYVSLWFAFWVSKCGEPFLIITVPRSFRSASSSESENALIRHLPFQTENSVKNMQERQTARTPVDFSSWSRRYALELSEEEGLGIRLMPDRLRSRPHRTLLHQRLRHIANGLGWHIQEHYKR